MAAQDGTGNSSPDEPRGHRAPKVFVSYSWDDNDHCDWVVWLATRLREVGVDAVLDRWDTRLGSDLAQFMQLVGNLDYRVLAIVSDGYREKSDDPTGGVGFEKSIIAASVMANLTSARIVPVLRNNTATQQRLPLYMGVRKYIDLQDGPEFEDNFRELVYDLHGKQVLPAPPLGLSPFDEYETDAQVRATLRHQPSRYTDRRSSGAAEFDYTNNNGRYTLGAGDAEVTLRLSQSGHGSVYVLNDPGNVRAVALAPGVADFAAIGDATNWDGSSRHRTVKVGDAAVLQNVNGYWTGVLVDEVYTRESSPTGQASIKFRFMTLPMKSPDFSKEPTTER